MKVRLLAIILLIGSLKSFIFGEGINFSLLDYISYIELGAFDSNDQDIKLVADVYGYVTPAGNEYALVCAKQKGLKIVPIIGYDLNENDIKHILEDTENYTIDVKVFQHFAFIANDQSGHINVINIYHPDYPVEIDPIVDNIAISHNLFIIGDVLYIASLDNGVLNNPEAEIDLFVYDISGPSQPQLMGTWNGKDNIDTPGTRNSIHDVFVQGNKIYMAGTAEGFFIGEFEIIQTEDGTSTWQLSDENTYQFSYRNVRDISVEYGYYDTSGNYNYHPSEDLTISHSVWANENDNIVYISDEHSIYLEPQENQGAVLRIFEIGDLSNYNNLSSYNPVNFLEPISYFDVHEDEQWGYFGEGNLPDAQNIPPTSIHNILLKYPFLYCSYYTKGLRVLDVEDPHNPIEVGYYDTPAVSDSEDPNAPGRGSFGVYPFLPSGNILLSDRDGLRLIKQDFIKKGSISSTETWSHYVYIEENTTIAPGVTVTVEPGTIIKIAPNVNFIIEGGIMALGSEEEEVQIIGRGNNLVFNNSMSEHSTFNHVSFKNIDLRINNLHNEVVVSDCSFDESGINIALTPNIEINNSTFTNNDYGIVSMNSSPSIQNCIFLGIDRSLQMYGSYDVVVNNCVMGSLFDGGGGITGIEIFASGGVISNNSIQYQSNGIVIVDGQQFSLVSNTIQHNQQNGVYLLESSDGFLDGNIIQYNGEEFANTGRIGGGVFCFASSPLLRINVIENNYINGLLTMHGSNPVLNDRERGLNRLEHNTFVSCQPGTGTPESAEILMFDSSIPLLRNGHNDIMDDQGCYLMYKFDDFAEVNLDVTLNYWAEQDAENITRRLFPSDLYRFYPFDTQPNTSASEQSANNGSAHAMMMTALQQEADEAWNSAVQTYKGIISQFPDSLESKGAVSRLLVSTKHAGQDIQNLKTYYDGVKLNHPNTILSKMADQYSILCDVTMQAYETAIARYEAILENPPSFEDSVYALIDIGQVYLLADMNNQNTSGKLIAGSTDEKYKPADKDEFYVFSQSILTELMHKKTNSNHTNIPYDFSLRPNYPNPFNPNTNISFVLHNDKTVLLQLYDITGKIIKTIVHDDLSKGYYNYRWSSQNNTGSAVSSGVYFYQLSTREHTQARKMLLIK